MIIWYRWYQTKNNIHWNGWKRCNKHRRFDIDLSNETGAPRNSSASTFLVGDPFDTHTHTILIRKMCTVCISRSISHDCTTIAGSTPIKPTLLDCLSVALPHYNDLSDCDSYSDKPWMVVPFQPPV